jgi:hypothetical protein
MSSRTVTPKRWKTLVAMGTAAGLAPSAALYAGTATDHANHNTGHAQVWLAQASGEAGESGEGGESGAAMDKPEKVKMLTGLALIEGHLRAGIALYEAGEVDMAKTHMKHPKAEIYTELEPMLGDDGFADELQALSDNVQNGADVAEAKSAFNAVLEAIEEAREDSNTSPRDQFDAMMATMRVAGEEYGIGIKDGAIDNIHEYQDAWGFTQGVKANAAALAKSNDEAVAAAAEKTLAALAETDAAFDGVNPQGNLNGEASALYGAAARIELAALSVK